ncbi:Heterogeneous nuclear ribonucleoprotein Q [Glycine soja]
MVKKEQIDLLCMQETKKERIEKTMCRALWGDSDVSWEIQLASNTGGGLLCLWSEKTFTMERKVSGSGFILLEGVWVQEAQKNIDIFQKRALWDIVCQMKNSNPGGIWCILGDFNNIRTPLERMDACQRGVDDRNIKEFNDWIVDLEDLRLLVSRQDIQKNGSGLLGKKSVKGMGGFVLKEKIKRLKERLKVWNKEQFGDTLKKLRSIEADLNKLEADTIDRQLSPQELLVRKKLQEDLWLAAQSHESLLRQKARSRWIRKGDCNSRFFHLMNSNHRNNSVKGVMIDGSWVDDPGRVKEAVRLFFSQRFEEIERVRPKLDGIRFQSIGQQQNDMLTGRFHEDEIKIVVKLVYVKNLPENITQDRLKELSEHHGKITKVVLPSAKTGQEKSRFGFVHFAERSSAMKALKNAEKYEIDGQTLECSLANSHKPAVLPAYPPHLGYGGMIGSAIGAGFGTAGFAQVALRLMDLCCPHPVEKQVNMIFNLWIKGLLTSWNMY